MIDAVFFLFLYCEGLHNSHMIFFLGGGVLLVCLAKLTARGKANLSGSFIGTITKTGN